MRIRRLLRIGNRTIHVGSNTRSNSVGCVVIEHPLGNEHLAPLLYGITRTPPSDFIRVPFEHSKVAANMIVVTVGFALQQRRPGTAAGSRNGLYRGFMYRGKQRLGLNSFVIVKDNQQCCFGRQPNQSDMVEVFLPPGETFDLELGLTGVAGTFRTSNIRSQSDLQFRPIYRIDADFCKRAKVDF